MDYENALISKIITEGCIDEVIGLSLSEDLFVEHKDVWKYLLATYSKHGGIPPAEHVEGKFSEIEIEVVETPITFIIEELRKRHVHNLVADCMKSQAKLLKDKDPFSALDIMRKVVISADQQAKPLRDVNMVEDPEKRLQAYDEIVDAGGVTGIPTPWDCLNEVTQGFHAQELIMIAGRSKVGKTWGESVLAWYNWTQGELPLLFSREMSIEQLLMRVDAVNAQIPHKRLRSGQLNTAQYERWKQSLKDMKDGNPFWLTEDDEGIVGVSGIAAKVQKYKPTIVYIDGGYLLDDERGARAGWERWSNICWDLKRLARRSRIPIVVSHQFNLKGKGDEGDATTLKYGDVEMWYDLIIGMYQTEDLKLNKEMLFKVTSQREGSKLEWVTEWDLDRMCFETKSSGTDDIGDTSNINPDEVVRY